MTESYKWLLERPSQPPTVLAAFDGIPSVMLFAIPSGARLWWMFEESESESLGVFVHLTGQEAQDVYTGTGGLLESVRPTLRNPHAVVWAAKGDRLVRATEFLIDGGIDEEEFANKLWDAAEETGGVPVPEAEAAYELLVHNH